MGDKKYTISNLREVIGEDLTKKMLENVGNEEFLVDWFFYQRPEAYEGRTPYELFKDKYKRDRSKLEGLIMDNIIGGNCG